MNRFKPVELYSAHIRHIESKIVEGMIYELNVALPNGYECTDRKYPVVYMLDAYELFGLQLQTYQQLVSFEHIVPLILVGINYRFEGKSFYDGLKDYLSIRSKDYTPTHLTREETIRRHQEIASALLAEFIPLSGGAEKFLEFLREELLPFIESEYRVETRKRGLLGYSLGGLFACYALFKDPKLFERVFIGSPFLRWDDEVVFKFYEESKFKALQDPVTVYLSVGERETQTFQRLWEKLRDLLERCPNLMLKAEKLEGEYHVTGLGSAYSRAFWRLFEKTYGGTVI